MSTLEATISMLEIMPEESRQMVFEYTQELFTSEKAPNPFIPVSEEKILKDLEISRQQVSEGRVRNMAEALEDMRKCHGFI